MPLRAAARAAIGRLTGLPFESQPLDPPHLLTAEARRYLQGAHTFPDGLVEVWVWDDGPSPRTVEPAEARSLLGLKFARRALELEPADRDAQAVFVGLMLQDAVDRVGPDAFPGQDPTGAYPTALAAGPEVLGEVLRRAIAAGQSDLAVAAAAALGRVAERDALSSAGPPPLVEALTAPDRRIQFAAARALVELAPPGPFPGASLVVPALARFLAPYSAPRAVVIDGVVNRANQTAGLLRGRGFEVDVARDGAEGFSLAAEGADVELVLIEPTALQGSWDLLEILKNLRADARTAGLPVVLIGEEQKIGRRLDFFRRSFPRVDFMVAAPDPQLFNRELDRVLERAGARPLSDAERTGLRPGGGGPAGAGRRAADGPVPGRPCPGRAGPDGGADDSAAIGPVASGSLGEVPTPEAQGGLAEVALDAAQADGLPRRGGRPARPQHPAVRLAAGPRAGAGDGRRLDGATDPALRGPLGAVVGALAPDPDRVGRRLQSFGPPAVGPAPAAVGATPGDGGP